MKSNYPFKTNKDSLLKLLPLVTLLSTSINLSLANEIIAKDNRQGIIWEKVNKRETKPINNLLHQPLFFLKTLFQVILLKFLPSNKHNGKEKIADKFYHERCYFS